jgi:uncharacterized coiled-coil DUF342 family protein
MMSSSSRHPEVERAYDHLDDVETQVPASVPHTPERLEQLRTSVEEYENAEDESDQVELLDRIDQEIDELRDAIEREVEAAADAAHEALAKTEQRLSELRDRLHS